MPSSAYLGMDFVIDVSGLVEPRYVNFDLTADSGPSLSLGSRNTHIQMYIFIELIILLF